MCVAVGRLRAIVVFPIVRREPATQPRVEILRAAPRAATHGKPKSERNNRQAYQ